MQHAELVSHVDTDLVSRAELRALPAPEATRTFKSIPHVELVDMLEIVLQQNQIRIEDERFALRRGGSVLFGVLQLAYGESPDGRAALGLRTANNKTMSIQLCAGLSVFRLRQPGVPWRPDRAPAQAHVGLEPPHRTRRSGSPLPGTLRASRRRSRAPQAQSPGPRSKSPDP